MKVTAAPRLVKSQNETGCPARFAIPTATMLALAPTGVVTVRGETWSAESLSGPLGPGLPVHVVGVEGVRLKVWSVHGVVPGAEILDSKEEEQ